MLADTLERAEACPSSSEEAPGDGRESLGTFESTCIVSLFSCELRGSGASLLGTGVMVEDRFTKDSELDFVVVSFRQDDDGVLLSLEVAAGEDVEVDVGPVFIGRVADLAKKPRMLCCFPVDDESVLLLLFLAVDGVLAGVRAGVLDLSPIFAEFRIN